jgi:hypothetical protein
MAEITVPEHIDGEALNEFLYEAISASAEPEYTINLQPGADYVLPYGLALGARRHSRLHPQLPMFFATDIVLNGNGATITIPPWDRTVPRTKNGVMAVHALWSERVTLRNLTTVGGLWSVHAHATEDLVLDNCRLLYPVLDWVYYSPGPMEDGDRDLNVRPIIRNCYMRGAKRQGIVPNAVHQFEMYGCFARGVSRYMFDIEPTIAGQCTEMYVHDNDLAPGYRGFLNYTGYPLTVPVDHWRFIGNKVNGNMRVSVNPSRNKETNELTRHNEFVFINNVNTDETPTPHIATTKPLIKVAGWDVVRVHDNTDYFTTMAKRTAFGACTDVVSEPNNWIDVQAA